MDDIDKIHALLKERGANLVRTKKHKVWRFPDGRIWVVASTPHSSQSHRNNYHDLCNFLGVDTTRLSNPERQRKKGVERPALTGIKASGVVLRDFRTELMDALRFVPPEPECFGMWHERFPRTPLWAILARIDTHVASWRMWGRYFSTWSGLIMRN